MRCNVAQKLLKLFIQSHTCALRYCNGEAAVVVVAVVLLVAAVVVVIVAVKGKVFL
jgi:hypothetical protein